MSCNSKSNETTVYPFKGILIDIMSSEYKMMITADDGTSFIFEMEYNEEGELDSKFAVLQEDEDGDLVRFFRTRR